ncbi:MAG: CinA family protein [Candidatus Poseidoniaceae archaeon]|nr:damage-inducible protein CinA [Euryarchaeota archaeon]|tara:strand:+ start:152 stop:829 length:678 start_codon:yes stop_codon:yes gene_type:complete
MDEEVQALAARLVRRLKSVNATITIAESCTGGLLASTLTDISGASEWFNQSWVCYSYDSKINELEVERSILETKGAVNAAVAIQMADGARKRSGADLAISITGIAGPVALNSNKPVGLVYVGIASAHWANAESVQMGGTRYENKISFVHFALRTAIDCWDRAKVRQEVAIAQKEKAAAVAVVELAKSDAANARRAAEASAEASWQDEEWREADGKIGDDSDFESP